MSKRVALMMVSLAFVAAAPVQAQPYSSDLHALVGRLIEVQKTLFALQEAGGRDSGLAETVGDAAETISDRLSRLYLGTKILETLECDEGRDAALIVLREEFDFAAEALALNLAFAKGFGEAGETHTLKQATEDILAIGRVAERLLDWEP